MSQRPRNIDLYPAFLHSGLRLEQRVVVEEIGPGTTVGHIATGLIAAELITTGQIMTGHITTGRITGNCIFCFPVPGH
jgi:hypothetical protein